MARRHFFHGFPGGFFGGFPGQNEDFGGFSQSPRSVSNEKYYRLLGVDKSIACADVRKAFRDIAKTKHPDKGGDPKEFAEISQAADVLSDPKKREVYDKYGEEGINKGIKDAGGPGMFGFPRERREKKKQKAAPLTVPIEITLDEVFTGCRKEVQFSRLVLCEQCNGMGYTIITECPVCHGQKEYPRMSPFGMVMTPCQGCKATGRFPDPTSSCPSCRRTKGKTEQRHQVFLDIEKGVSDGFEYTVAGEGDFELGKDNGDLLIRVQSLPHSTYKRRGADLILPKTITLSEALTGYSFSISHIDHTEHLLYSQPGEIIHPGDIRTIEDLGLPLFRDPIKHGCLFVRFEVELPSPNYLTYDVAEKLKTCFGQGNEEIEGIEAEEHYTEMCEAVGKETGKNTILDQEIPRKVKDKRRERPDLHVFYGHSHRVPECSGTIF